MGGISGIGVLLKIYQWKSEKCHAWENDRKNPSTQIYIYNIITNLLILKKNLYLIPPHGGIVHCKKAKNLISFFLHYLNIMFYGTKQENAT
jgi:hypothetical protein